jgi:hypothetical protein
MNEGFNVPTTTHLTFCMAIFDYKIIADSRSFLFFSFTQQCNQFDSTPRSSAKSTLWTLGYFVAQRESLVSANGVRM